MMFAYKALPQVAGFYRFEYSLKDLTWFKVGGACDVFFRPKDLADLQYFLMHRPATVPLYILGAGSNTLIRDGGIRGIVIKLGQGFTQMSLNEERRTITVGGGTLNHHVVQLCTTYGLGGLEFLIGIPGTIGGGIMMNAGIGSIEFKDIVQKVTVIDYQGNLKTLTNQEIKFYYRGTNLKEVVVVEAELSYLPDTPANVEQQVDHFKQRRAMTQPVTAKTCGSVFRNPEALKAWQLIDQVGLRGKILGGAQISTMHSNFIINLGEATAQDIESLGELARAKVLEQLGINLQWEIYRIGDATI